MSEELTRLRMELADSRDASRTWHDKAMMLNSKTEILQQELAAARACFSEASKDNVIASAKIEELRESIRDISFRLLTRIGELESRLSEARKKQEQAVSEWRAEIERKESWKEACQLREKQYIELEDQLAKTEQARENWATVARERGEEIDALIIAMAQRAEGGS